MTRQKPEKGTKNALTAVNTADRKRPSAAAAAVIYLYPKNPDSFHITRGAHFEYFEE